MGDACFRRNIGESIIPIVSIQPVGIGHFSIIAFGTNDIWPCFICNIRQQIQIKILVPVKIKKNSLYAVARIRQSIFNRFIGETVIAVVDV